MEKSSKPEHNRNQLDLFCKYLQILHYDNNAAEHYGDIRADLERKGMIIGANDLLIAAPARSLRLVLVSNNLAEFDRVEGLTAINWIEI